MSNASVFNSLKAVSAAYSKLLTQIPAADFQTTPPDGGWSYSEVYCHIFDASILSLYQLEASTNGKGEKKPTHFIVKLILFFGRLPRQQKYKVPKRLESRVKKITIEEAAEFISQFLIRLTADYPEIGRADTRLKSKHPRLGYLNAAQWLRFIEIHLKHHLKQLKRIEKSF